MSPGVLRILRWAAVAAVAVAVAKELARMRTTANTPNGGITTSSPAQAPSPPPLLQEPAASIAPAAEPTDGPAALPPAAPGFAPLPQPLAGALRPPSVQTLRDEVARNPHGPSPTYVAWASALALDMEGAKTSATHAQLTFGRLMTCLAGEGAETVTAVCLMHARELAELYPAWRPLLADIERRLPPRVLDLLR